MMVDDPLVFFVFVFIGGILGTIVGTWLAMRHSRRKK